MILEKPTQYKRLHRDADNIDLLDSLENAMDSIASAMESLSGYEAFSDWFDVLSDLWDEMKPRHEEYERIDAAEYSREIEGLTRDYYRSVL